MSKAKSMKEMQITGVPGLDGLGVITGMASVSRKRQVRTLANRAGAGIRRFRKAQKEFREEDK